MNTQLVKSIGSLGIASGVPDEDAQDVGRGMAPVPTASIKRKSYVEAIKNRDYVPPEDLKNCPRSAHFIVWCVVNYPKEVLEWRWVYAAITHCTKAQPSESREVRLLQGRANDIGKVMLKKYRVTIHTDLGGYVRGAYDDGDAADTALRKKQQRYESAQRSMIEVAQVIDPAKIKNKALAAWVVKVRSSIRSLESTVQKLLPPPKKMT